jgi:hypothetical protein
MKSGDFSNEVLFKHENDARKNEINRHLKGPLHCANILECCKTIDETDAIHLSCRLDCPRRIRTHQLIQNVCKSLETQEKSAY